MAREVRRGGEEVKIKKLGLASVIVERFLFESLVDGQGEPSKGTSST